MQRYSFLLNAPQDMRTTLTLSGGQIVGMQDSRLESCAPLSASQIADLRLAASKMSGPTQAGL